MIRGMLLSVLIVPSTVQRSVGLGSPPWTTHSTLTLPVESRIHLFLALTLSGGAEILDRALICKRNAALLDLLIQAMSPDVESATLVLEEPFCFLYM